MRNLEAMLGVVGGTIGSGGLQCVTRTHYPRKLDLRENVTCQVIQSSIPFK